MASCRFDGPNVVRPRRSNVPVYPAYNRPVGFIYRFNGSRAAAPLIFPVGFAISSPESFLARTSTLRRRFVEEETEFLRARTTNEIIPTQRRRRFPRADPKKALSVLTETAEEAFSLERDAETFHRCPPRVYEPAPARNRSLPFRLSGSGTKSSRFREEPRRSRFVGTYRRRVTA